MGILHFYSPETRAGRGGGHPGYRGRSEEHGPEVGHHGSDSSLLSVPSGGDAGVRRDLCGDRKYLRPSHPGGLKPSERCGRDGVSDGSPGDIICTSDGAEVTFRTAKDTAPQEGRKPDQEEKEYILNTNTMKFHAPACSSAEEMGPEKKRNLKEPERSCWNRGYSPCGRCKP